MLKLPSMRTFIHVVLLVQRLPPSFVNFFQVPRGVIFFLQKLQVTRHVLLQIFTNIADQKVQWMGHRTTTKIT